MKLLNYILFRILGGFLNALPLKIQKYFIKLLSKFLTIILKKYRIRVKNNLEIVFGKEFAQSNTEEFTEACITNLIENSLIIVAQLSTKEITKKVIFKNREIVDKLIKENKSIIFSSAHYGNWELLASALASNIMPLVGVVKKIRNRYINNFLVKNRTRFNSSIILSKGAVVGFTKAIKQGKSVYIMADQSIKGGELHYIFGKLGNQSTINRFLTQKLGAVVVPTFIEKIDNNKYLITFFNPLDSETENITSKEIDILEKMILKNPKNWLWCHNRWKIKIK